MKQSDLACFSLQSILATKGAIYCGCGEKFPSAEQRFRLHSVALLGGWLLGSKSPQTILIALPVSVTKIRLKVIIKNIH